MLLIAMDSSFRWDDENRLVQSVPRAMIDVGIAYRSIVSCGSSQLNRGSESAAGESVKEIGGGNWTELSQKFQSDPDFRSVEHTSELQSLMRISYAVFCLKNKNNSYFTNY